MTRICPRCQSVNTLVMDYGTVPTCIACGWHPEGIDVGPGPQAASALGVNRPGRETHTMGAGRLS